MALVRDDPGVRVERPPGLVHVEACTCEAAIVAPLARVLFQTVWRIEVLSTRSKWLFVAACVFAVRLSMGQEPFWYHKMMTFAPRSR